MPKSKVRKKAVYTPPPGEGRSRTPVKVAGPTHPVYIAVMLGLMLLGLVWLVVNYIAGPNIAWMNALGSWNFLIGFALIVIGLLMTMSPCISTRSSPSPPSYSQTDCTRRGQ